MQDDFRLAAVEADAAGDVDGPAIERMDVGKGACVAGKDHRRETIMRIVPPMSRKVVLERRNVNTWLTAPSTVTVCPTWAGASFGATVAARLGGAMKASNRTANSVRIVVTSPRQHSAKRANEKSGID